MQTIRAFVCAVLAAACEVVTAQEARAKVDIQAQPLRLALKDLGEQTGLQIVFRVEDVAKEAATAPRVAGELAPSEALEKLLSKSRLRYQFVNATTVLISSNNAGAADKAARVSTEVEESAHPLSTAATAQSPPREELQEVLVTAQKRTERLQDVPIPVSALAADALASNNQQRIQDYFTRIPALSFTPGLFGQPFLVIRGVTTGSSSSANPSVGIMIDDIPYGSATGIGGGGFGAPDIDPSDLERIEVLRGPQGTLYGAASIGGLFKFVTVDPSTDRISGHVQAGTSSVRDGNKLGHNVRGSINVPLSDTLAVRASGVAREDPGYIDDPGLGLKDVNKTDVDGGRLSALWRPSDLFSLKLSALLQHQQAHGLPYIQPALGENKQSFALKRLITDNRSQAYGATANLRLGKFDLVAITGYSNDKAHSTYDYTSLLDSALNEALLGVSGTGTAYVVNHKLRKFSQEVRVSGSISEKVDLLLGGFYTDEHSPSIESIYAANPADASLVANWVDFIIPAGFSEYAAFADLTFHFNDRFDLQVGGRESRNRQSYFEEDIGPFNDLLLGVPSPVINPKVITNDNSFTYLFTPRFKITPHIMSYARLASGYRPGGPNLSATALAVPPHFAPDKALNYELGLKGDALDRELSFDASVYYIDWRDLQIQLREPISNLVYYANAGRAKSQGLELSTIVRPWDGFSISVWGAWNDAELTEAFPVSSKAYGISGDRLPFSSKFSGNASVDQEFHLSGSVTTSIGASVSYVGDRKGVFRGITAAGPQPRQDFPAYVTVDLNTGMKYESWAVNLNVSNLFDRRAMLIGGLGFIYPDSFAYVQPRTISLSVTRSF